MPRRSNRFQELVAMLTALLGDDAVVEESKMLTDLVSGEEREVDICAERLVAGHKAIVSIECRDHRRKQTVGWVEEMRAKHDRLPTNMLVLVSSSGFTKSALAKAESYGIKAITPSGVTAEFVGEIVNRLDSLWVKQLDITPDETGIDIESATLCDPTALTGDPQLVEGWDEVMLYRSDGTSVMSSTDYQNLVWSEFLSDQSFMRDVVEGECQFEIILDEPPYLSEPLYVLATAGGGPPTLVRITRMVLTRRGQVHVGEVALTHGDFDGTSYSTGDDVRAGHTFRFVIAEATSGAAPLIRVRVLVRPQ